ncbi:MAG TPA: YigZ family protein [Chitinophagales bacterium]|nr:YigZ family protein [Chitinophagales bacterium]
MAEYFSIEPVENILYKDKGSKFIGYAYPVKDEAAIKEKLEFIRQEHPKATHHCYAYRLGLDKNNYRTNDDGEPNGTAGKPMLGQIDSIGITNTLVVVVRYFGGTKLGVSGLIDAYKETARETLAVATIITHKILDYYRIRCAYEQVQRVYHIVHQVQAQIISQELDILCAFEIAVTEEQRTMLEKKLTEEQLTFEWLYKR